MAELQELKAALKARGLRVTLSMGESHACLAQWWAYEAFYSYERGDYSDSLSYIKMSKDELALYDKEDGGLKEADFNKGQVGFIQAMKASKGLAIK